MFAESTAVGGELGNTDTIVNGEAELALLAMEAGGGTRPPIASPAPSRSIDEHRMHDYAASVLAFAAAARLALHRRRRVGARPRS